MRKFDFNKPKNTWEVTLPGKDTAVHVRTPSKGLFAEIQQTGARLLSLEKDGDQFEALGEIYEVVAKALSNNAEGVEVDPDELVQALSTDDLIDFLTEYSKFINEVLATKN